MPIANLGRLERVTAIREVWLSEATDFTPWLAIAENLSVLGDALGLELELEAQEKPVGLFRADIVCREIATGSRVLIENQLERTDHSHLGQLLTYASGLEAVTIVWVAAQFNEEHRATLDWLNRITLENFRFFGAEVELWRIGTSAIAPRFNVIAKPNDWARSIAKAAQALEDGELSENRVMQRDYWAGLHQELQQQRGPVSGNRTPQPQSWMNYSIGRTGFTLGASMARAKKEIRAELYIDLDNAKMLLKLLKQQQSAIEGELGFPMDWQELPGKRASRIVVVQSGVDPTDRTKWKTQHEWLAKMLNQLHQVFARRVVALDVDPAIEPAGDLMEA